MKNRQFKLGLGLILALAFASCTDEETSYQKAVSDATNYQVLQANDDLSNVNLQSFIDQNDNIEIVLSDDVKLQFTDINHPIIEDPEADVVYVTADGRGLITFGANGTMYFMTTELETTSENAPDDEKWVRSYWGRLNSDASIIADRKIEFAERRQKEDEPSFITLPTSGKNVFVEYERQKVADETANFVTRIPENHARCYVEQDSSINKNQQPRLNKSHVKPFKIRVYTFNKALSNDDISRAKVVTWNSLTYGFNSNVFKALTYFSAAHNGNKIASFSGRKSNGDSLLVDWDNYLNTNKISGYTDRHTKFLLLTDFSVGSIKGMAYKPGQRGWAQVDHRKGYTAAHEAGHMLDASHTGAYWTISWFVFGWWTGSVMYQGSSWDWIKHHPRHTIKGRREIYDYKKSL